MKRSLCATMVAVWIVTGSGCATTHTPVTVVAQPGAAPLDGIWTGTYESRETGRTGQIFLAMSADADSAVGEVVMVPRGQAVSVRQSDGRWRWQGVARPQVLTIRFVRLAGAEVVGELDPYRDPDCGCELRTTFRGEIEGDTVFGTFDSGAEHAYHDAEGTWQASRQPDREP